MNLLLAEGGDSSWLYIVILIALFAIMIIPTYIRNKKENTKRQEVMSQLKVGDSIITTAGVFGRIVSVRETTIGKVYVIETGDNDHKSFQEIHADAIMGVDTKRDIILDADGNDITFADEDNKEKSSESEKVIEEKVAIEDVAEKEEVKEDIKENKPSKAKKASKDKK